jgi:hypothetical protein
MRTYGTDIGPPCGDCFEHIWVYSFEEADPLPRAVHVRCACCNAERAELECGIDEPTIGDLRRLHQARVDAVRDEVNALIHGRGIR